MDAVSDDGQCALTAIAFLGSVFSPYYARARRHEEGSWSKHLAINLALYRRGAPPTWVFVERDARALARSARSLRIGSSSVEHREDRLVWNFLERSSPFPRLVPRTVEGTLSLEASASVQEGFHLDPAGRHRWWPRVPSGRVQVDFPGLGVRWSGRGYHDCNLGTRPLEDDFTRWSWGRFHHEHSGETTLSYDAELRDGSRTELGLRVSPTDGCVVTELPSIRVAGTTGWQLPVRARGDLQAPSPRLLQSLEDTPFYGRHLVQTTLLGEPVTGVTEIVDLERFQRRWVQALLPFRMRRG